MASMTQSLEAGMKITMAAEELFVNIAHYAYPGESGIMKLGVQVDNGTATLRFVDYGIRFDPLHKEDPDVTMDANTRKIGGLGIFMVKKAMDQGQYERRDNQNMLIITKEIG